MQTNHEFLAHIHEEIGKNESLDGLNYLILYSVLAKTEQEVESIHKYIGEFQKYSQNPEKKIRNQEKFKLVLYYLRNEYPNDEIIANFVEKNKNVLNSNCSNHYKTYLNVKTLIQHITNLLYFKDFCLFKINGFAPEVKLHTQ